MKRRSDYEAIAIIGVGCRFPGGVRGLRSFWELLTSEVDPIGDVPSNRWDANAHFNADSSAPNRMTIRQGGFLPDSPEEFDAAFFGMTPRDAAGLDPQQRVLLEVTWEAFEDAGLPISTTAGTSVGTYIGGFTLDAMTLQLSESNRVLTSGSTATSVGLAMLSARLSHTFDWRGPCFTVDTACSSSLVALHQACVALARGESGIAVAGGVNVMFNPVTTVLMSKGRFLSPDARCKSFDHRANGYVRSEGAGVVVLKPLSAALRDGNHVHAVVRGSAVNQDGRTPGVTVPSGEAQIAVINRAFQEAGVTPDSVGYFEAHGTGTAVGDPIEAEAIGSVLRDSDRAHWLGSVKSNIGHTEAAAGVAGLIKAVLCVQHGQIPPNLHFERPNPGIRFEELPLRVPTSVVPFPALPGPRRASINSFGFGGTNAHAVIEQAPISPEPERGAFDGSDVPLLLPLSARTPEALAATIKSYEEVFGRSAAPSFREVCRAASRQRDHHAVRTFVVAENSGEAVTGLANLNGARSAHSRERGVAFVYPGMGPQWWGMGRELLEEEPRFRDVVRACDEVLARFGISMAEELARPEHESKLTRTRYAQVANFVVQAGLTAVWRGWGIEPVAIVGHSVGEVAAAYAAGVYSLEDALTISFHRARLQAGLAGMGVMAAAGASEAEIRPHLLGGVEVAAVNSSSTTTLSGDPQVMDVVAERLRDAGVNVQPLRVEVAYHSHQMDGIREQLLSALAAITPSEAVVPLYSTVTGGQVGGEELNAAYWWRNVRQPVRFADAFRRLLAREPGQVLEVGPHPVLATAIDEAIAGSGSSAGRFASLVRNQPQRRQLAETLGALYVAGADPDWSGVYPGALGRVELPAYPWQRERHWLETEESARARLGSGGLALAGRVVAATSPTRDVDLSTGEFPYLEDHKVDGAVVFPGTGYLEVALAGFADETPCVLEDISFDHPLVLGKGSVTTLRVEHDLERRSVLMHSREYGDNVPWTLHVRMRKPQLAKPKTPSVHTESLTRLTARLTEVGQEDIYAHLKNRRLDYGPAFRAVERLWCHNEAGEIYASLRTDTVVPDGHRLHPALLDAALHAMIVGASLLSGEQDDKTYVPERIDTLRFHRSVGQKLWVRGRQRQSGADRLTCDMTLITDDGEVVAELLGVHARALTRDKGEGVAEATPQHYESSWHAADFGDCDDRKGTWIVVGSGLGRTLSSKP
ncbi:type I polyketide synthase [Amycolatopsis sp. EV170708-02-1]|uniref:type I polyketide synthase n=1 Tax=Amycolatopsis sp. EV170708-02-1 TaxID=2919322 RepID=UPI001F0C24E8|nr:type I polyketide synthase [Amycolatopsis sp. EV170708-02-1]UMP06978.1 acyltransferase domain-containing protein [Amycolatopsis sp. EV170708-02-1]